VHAFRRTEEGAGQQRAESNVRNGRVGRDGPEGEAQPGLQKEADRADANGPVKVDVESQNPAYRNREGGTDARRMKDFSRIHAHTDTQLPCQMDPES